MSKSTETRRCRGGLPKPISPKRLEQVRREANVFPSIPSSDVRALLARVDELESELTRLRLQPATDGAVSLGKQTLS